MAVYDLPADQNEVTVTDARANFPRLLELAERDGRRIYVTTNGHRTGAIVPAEVAERSEEEEDAYWSARARGVLAAGEPAVPWDEAVRMLETGTAGE